MINPKAQSWSFMGARHQTNDDAVLMNPEQGIYVVCDGVSEGGQGKFASQMIARTIQEKLSEGIATIKQNGSQLLGAKRLQTMHELLLQAFAEAQTNLQIETSKDPLHKNAATTCIALWMDGRFGILAHIGDSRAYLYRSGKIYQLTKDHSGLDILLAANVPLEVAQKNPLSRSLSRAFGGNVRYSNPDLLKLEFQPMDTLVLCTDGVYTAFAQHNVQSLIQSIVEGKKNIKELVETCAHKSGDDASMIQIQFPAELYQDVPLQASERIKLIQQTPLCKYFDYIQKSHIAAICELEQYKAGSVIVQEGTDGEIMYIIASGTLEVINKGQHLTYMTPGEFFGEIALIQYGKRSATVIAKEDTLLLSLKRADLNEVFKKDPIMEKHFYKAMFESTLDRLLRQGNELAKMKGV